MKYLTCLIAIALMGACSHSDDDLLNLTNQAQITQNLQSGNWKITNFNDSGQDETHNFTNFIFTFNDDGSIIAQNANSSFSGNWSITDNDSDDDSTDDLDFNLNFNTTSELEELNDDWDILNYTTSKIELIDISGGNGGTDYLTFEHE